MEINREMEETLITLTILEESLLLITDLHQMEVDSRYLQQLIERYKQMVVSIKKKKMVEHGGKEYVVPEEKQFSDEPML